MNIKKSPKKRETPEELLDALVKGHLTRKFGIQFQNMKSSNLWFGGYDQKHETLYMTFRNHNQEPQVVYTYQVLPLEWQELTNAESRGRYFNANLKERLTGKLKYK